MQSAASADEINAPPDESQQVQILMISWNASPPLTAAQERYGTAVYRENCIRRNLALVQISPAHA
eukprot:6182973-Pleurochrysis_carterae.AAC.2